MFFGYVYEVDIFVVFILFEWDVKCDVGWFDFFVGFGFFEI